MAPHDHDDDVITDVLSNLDVDETNERSDDERTIVRRVTSADLVLPADDDEETIVRKALPREFLDGPPPPGVRKDTGGPPPRPPRPTIPDAVDGAETAPRDVPSIPRPPDRSSSRSPSTSNSLPAPPTSASDGAGLGADDSRQNPWPKRSAPREIDASADKRVAKSLELAARAGHSAPADAETDLHDISDPPAGISRSDIDRPDTSEQLRRLGLSRSKPMQSYDPDTTGTGFYSLPPEEVEEQVQPRTAPQLIARGGLTAVAGGIIATLAIIATTMTQWLAPGDTLLWTIVALFPVTIAGVIVCWPIRGEAFGLRHAAGALGPAAVVGVIGLLVAGMWDVDGVRASAVGIAPHNIDVAKSQLEDQSDAVYQAACARSVARHESPQWRHLLVSSMTSRPVAAARCLSEADEVAQTALAPSLVDRWHRHLLSAEDENVCSYASALSMLPLERGELDARLLNCTLGAATTEVQTCCADVLSSTVSDEGQWVEHIRATIGYVRDDETATGLLAMAFHQKNLTEAQTRLAEAVSFDGDGARVVALEFACDTINSGKTGSTPHLAASLEGHCPLDTAQIPPGRTIWSGICANALERIEAEKNPKTLPALCAGAQTVLTGDAIVAASGLVVHAVQDDQAQQLSRDIDIGFIRQREDQPQATGLDRIRRQKERARRRAKAERGEFPDAPNF